MPAWHVLCCIVDALAFSAAPAMLCLPLKLWLPCACVCVCVCVCVFVCAYVCGRVCPAPPGPMAMALISAGEGGEATTQ